MAFRYQYGQWWFGDEAKGEWFPTLGEYGRLPPLEYMDVASLFIPAELDWRPATPDFPVWSMMPQTEAKDEWELEEQLKNTLLNADPFYKHMLLLAWHNFKKAPLAEMSTAATKQRFADPRGLYEWFVRSVFSRFEAKARTDRLQ